VCRISRLVSPLFDLTADSPNIDVSRRFSLNRCAKCVSDRRNVSVERSPEKAGVGGSTPSLATIFSVT